MKHRRHRILNGVVKMSYVRAALITLSALLFAATSQAKDFGQYRNVPHDIKAWIEALTDERGVPCCATADGSVPEAWGMGPHHYRVKIHGVWLDVPDGAVIRATNRLGRPVVWIDSDGETMGVRCFLPGPLT